MFGLESLSTELIGLLASFVAGLMSLFPILGVTSQRRALTAVFVILIAVLGQNGFEFVSVQEFIRSFAEAAVYAVVSYSLLLKSLVLPAVGSAATLIGDSMRNAGGSSLTKTL